MTNLLLAAAFNGSFSFSRGIGRDRERGSGGRGKGEGRVRGRKERREEKVCKGEHIVCISNWYSVLSMLWTGC